MSSITRAIWTGTPIPLCTRGNHGTNLHKKPTSQYVLPFAREHATRFPSGDHPSAGETPRSFLIQEREGSGEMSAWASHSPRHFAFLGEKDPLRRYPRGNPGKVIAQVRLGQGSAHRDCQALSKRNPEGLTPCHGSQSPHHGFGPCPPKIGSETPEPHGGAVQNGRLKEATSQCVLASNGRPQNGDSKAVPEESSVATPRRKISALFYSLFRTSRPDSFPDSGRDLGLILLSKPQYLFFWIYRVRLSQAFSHWCPFRSERIQCRVAFLGVSETPCDV